MLLSLTLFLALLITFLVFFSFLGITLLLLLEALLLFGELRLKLLLQSVFLLFFGLAIALLFLFTHFLSSEFLLLLENALANEAFFFLAGFHGLLELLLVAASQSFEGDLT